MTPAQRRAKLIAQTNTMNEKIARVGFKAYREQEFNKKIMQVTFSILAAPVLIIGSNLAYLIWEIVFILSRLITLNKLSRGAVQRDSDTKQLYRDYYLFDKDLRLNKPFLVWTPFCPRWFQAQGFIY